MRAVTGRFETEPVDSGYTYEPIIGIEDLGTMCVPVSLIGSSIYVRN
jgi:hypothetical protein